MSDATPPVVPERDETRPEVRLDTVVPVDRLAGEPAPSRAITLISIGLALSIALHAGILGFGLINLPRHLSPDEEAVPVTVVEDTPKPEPPKEQPKEKPQEKPPEQPKQLPQEQPKPETAKPEETPPPPKPAPQTNDKPSPTTPQAAATPSAPAKPVPPPKAAPDAAAAPDTSAPETAQATPGGAALSALDDKGVHDAVAALRVQIERCWTIPTGWTSPRQVTVVIDLQLDRSGRLVGRPVPVEFPANQLGMIAAKNALDAIAKCAPYRLPADQYGKWHEAQVRLSPH